MPCRFYFHRGSSLVLCVIGGPTFIRHLTTPATLAFFATSKSKLSAKAGTRSITPQVLIGGYIKERVFQKRGGEEERRGRWYSRNNEYARAAAVIPPLGMHFFSSLYREVCSVGGVGGGGGGQFPFSR